MDEVKQTTAPAVKAAPSKVKKLISVIIVIAILAAGGATAYYLLKSDPKTSESNSTTSSEQTPVADPNPKLTDDQVKEIRQRYENSKKTISTALPKSDVDKVSLYASAAFDGAQLNDPEAKTFAAKALELIPASERNKPENKPYTDYFNHLTDISKGNYESSQGYINTKAQ